ncbi:MAG: hypothetical protein AB8H80_03570 [Planctomycetota bacterium]
MPISTALVLLLAASSAVAAWQQDPKPAASAPAAQAGSNPAPKAAPKAAPEKHKFEGVYELRRRVLNGIDDKKRSRGFLAITKRHLILTLAQGGVDEDHPLVHSGIREWQQVGETVRTTVKLDYFSDGAGKIHLQPGGKQEVRKLELIRGGLRVRQGARTWLEFERIE